MYKRLANQPKIFQQTNISFEYFTNLHVKLPASRGLRVRATARAREREKQIFHISSLLTFCCHFAVESFVDVGFLVLSHNTHSRIHTDTYSSSIFHLLYVFSLLLILFRFFSSFSICCSPCPGRMLLLTFIRR